MVMRDTDVTRQWSDRLLGTQRAPLCRQGKLDGLLDYPWASHFPTALLSWSTTEEASHRQNKPCPVPRPPPPPPRRGYPLPWHDKPYLLHLGLQCYDRHFLKEYCRLPPTPLQVGGGWSGLLACLPVCMCHACLACCPRSSSSSDVDSRRSSAARHRHASRLPARLPA